MTVRSQTTVWVLSMKSEGQWVTVGVFRSQQGAKEFRDEAISRSVHTSINQFALGR